MNEPHSLRSQGRVEDGDGALSRSVLFPIRLTPAERATLSQLAGERGVTAAAFVRAAALGSCVPPRRTPLPPVPPINREAYWHLGQVGNNLNQIARRLNMAEGDGPTLVEVRRALEELGALVRQVRLHLVGWPEPEGK